MKGTCPRFVYILMTVLGASVLVINAWMDLTAAVCAIGAGLFAYGVNRLIGEWRVTHDPEYARQLEIANKDERLAYIADKSRSMTLKAEGAYHLGYVSSCFPFSLKFISVRKSRKAEKMAEEKMEAMLREKITDAVRAVKAANPMAGSVTNTVTMNFVADAGFTCIRIRSKEVGARELIRPRQRKNLQTAGTKHDIKEADRKYPL